MSAALVPRTVVAGDGARFNLYLTQLESLTETAPVLLFWPAMGINAAYYFGLARPLAALGVRLICADWRGIASSSVRAGWRADFDFKTLVEQDFAPAVAAVEQAYPNASLLLGGHSLGGQLALLRAAVDPNTIDGIFSIASCSVYWRTFSKRPFKMMLGCQATAVISQIWGHLPGKRLGFGGREARGVIRDWAHQARSGCYQSADFDFEPGLKRAQLPALVISLDGDSWGLPSAVDHLANKLESADFTRLHLVDPAIQATRKPHFHWVQAPESVLNALANWAHRVNRQTQ